MTNIRKYLAIALLFSNVAVCNASGVPEEGLAPRKAAVVHSQNTISRTAKATLFHFGTDVAYAGTQAAMTASEFKGFFILAHFIQKVRLFSLGFATANAVLDANRYSGLPYKLFAANMLIHATADIVAELPQMLQPYNVSDIAASSMQTFERLAFPISVVTLLISIYRFSKDGTFRAVWNIVRKEKEAKALLPTLTQDAKSK